MKIEAERYDKLAVGSAGGDSIWMATFGEEVNLYYTLSSLCIYLR